MDVFSFDNISIARVHYGETPTVVEIASPPDPVTVLDVFRELESSYKHRCGAT